MSSEVESFKRALTAADNLAVYRAVVRQACTCGCRVYFPVRFGLRCASCWPPLGMPEAKRRIVEASFDLVEGEEEVKRVARWPD